MPEKREIEINVKTGSAVDNVDKLTDAIEGTNKEAKKTNQTMSDLEGAADKFTGGFITGLKKGRDALKGIGKGIVDGIKGLKTMRITSASTFKAIKVGIASTGMLSESIDRFQLNGATDKPQNISNKKIPKDNRGCSNANR